MSAPRTASFSSSRLSSATIYYFDFRNQVGWAWLILLLFHLNKFGLRQIKNERWLQLTIITFLILYLGYSLILVHTRYVWLNTWLMVLMCCWFIQGLLDSEGQRHARRFFLVLIMFVAIKRPVKEILFSGDKNIPLSWLSKSVRHPFTTLWINYRPERELSELTELLKNKNGISGNMASLKSNSKERDPFTVSLRIARSMKNKYHGQLSDQLPLDRQIEELRNSNVKFLITHQNQNWGDDDPVFFNSLYGIRIYQIESR
jgi:hypothetical protein